jgi:hypothetical protein
MIESMFKGWFTDAIASAFIVAVVLAVIGGLCALLLSSHVKDAEPAETGSPARGGAETAITEVAAAEVDAL